MFRPNSYIPNNNEYQRNSHFQSGANMMLNGNNNINTNFPINNNSNYNQQMNNVQQQHSQTINNFLQYQPYQNFRRKTEITNPNKTDDPKVYKLKNDLLTQIEIKQKMKEEEKRKRKQEEEEEERKLKEYYERKDKQFSTSKLNKQFQESHFIQQNKQEKKQELEEVKNNKYHSSPREQKQKELIENDTYQPKLGNDLRKKILEDELSQQVEELKKHVYLGNNELGSFIGSLRSEVLEAQRLRVQAESELFNLRAQVDKKRELEAVFEEKFRNVLEKNAPYNNLHIPYEKVHPLYKREKDESNTKLVSESEFIYEKQNKEDFSNKPNYNNKTQGYSYKNNINQNEVPMQLPEPVRNLKSKNSRFYLEDNIQTIGSIKHNMRNEVLNGPNSMEKPLASESEFKPINEVINDYDYENRVLLNNDRVRVNNKNNEMIPSIKEFDYNKFIRSDKENRNRLEMEIEGRINENLNKISEYNKNTNKEFFTNNYSNNHSNLNIQKKSDIKNYSQKPNTYNDVLVDKAYKNHDFSLYNNKDFNRDIQKINDSFDFTMKKGFNPNKLKDSINEEVVKLQKYNMFKEEDIEGDLLKKKLDSLSFKNTKLESLTDHEAMIKQVFNGKSSIKDDNNENMYLSMNYIKNEEDKNNEIGGISTFKDNYNSDKRNYRETGKFHESEYNNNIDHYNYRDKQNLEYDNHEKQEYNNEDKFNILNLKDVDSYLTGLLSK